MGRRNAVVAALALVPLLLAFRPGLMGGSGPQTSSGGSSGGGASCTTPNNIPTQNIFDSCDPLCDGTDPSIILCDGFEDGTFLVDGSDGIDASDDYWATQAGISTDPAGRDFAECLSTTLDDTKSDFGAAGTLCMATTHWTDGVAGGGGGPPGAQGWHRIWIASGDPTSANSADGPYDVSIRFYFKETGVESTRCSAGWPNCAAFNYVGAPSGNNNGYKFVEFESGFTSGGINAPLISTLTKADVVSSVNHLFTLDDRNGACTTPSVLAEQNYPSGSPTYFDHMAVRGHWIFIEARIRIVAGDHRLMLWMDDCGADGLGCTGTPTLRIDSGSLNATNTCGPGTNGLKTVWFNFYSGGLDDGQIDFDEIVVRNNEVDSTPIGFMAPVTMTP